MGKVKSRKKMWLFVGIGALVVIGGVYMLYSQPSLKIGTVEIGSQCKFDPYVSDKNKKLIEETITTVAHKGVFSLMGEKSHLQEMGRTLSREVPDLAYWAYILKDPKLKSDMLIIRKSSPKYNGFVEGTQDRLIQENRENSCLLEEAKGFAKYVGISEEETVFLLKKSLENEGKDEDRFEDFLDYILTGKLPEKD